MNQRAVVKNAADEAQVKKAKIQEEDIRLEELNDLRVVLSMKEGRRFLWRLLTHCKVFESIWEPSAKIHYLAGSQDIGHFIMAEISDAGQDYLFKMMEEAKKEKENA